MKRLEYVESFKLSIVQEDLDEINLELDNGVRIRISQKREAHRAGYAVIPGMLNINVSNLGGALKLIPQASNSVDLEIKAE